MSSIYSGDPLGNKGAVESTFLTVWCVNMQIGIFRANKSSLILKKQGHYLFIFFRIHPLYTTNTPKIHDNLSSTC